MRRAGGRVYKSVERSQGKEQQIVLVPRSNWFSLCLSSAASLDSLDRKWVGEADYSQPGKIFHLRSCNAEQRSLGQMGSQKKSLRICCRFCRLSLFFLHRWTTCVCLFSQEFYHFSGRSSWTLFWSIIYEAMENIVKSKDLLKQD